MSEYTPITTDMRLLLGCFNSLTDFEHGKFTQLCDAIDSIHAQLERENEDLRMKFVTVNRHAEHVERENESLKAELNRVLGEQERDGWVELPKDVDGEYIHIGDRMENNERVSRIVLTDDDWQPSVYLEKIPNVLHEYFCNEISHYHPDTWESIICDAMQAGRTDASVDVTPLIERCKALCERTKGDA